MFNKIYSRITALALELRTLAATHTQGGAKMYPQYKHSETQMIYSNYTFDILQTDFYRQHLYTKIPNANIVRKYVRAVIIRSGL